MPAPPKTPKGEDIREKILLYGDSDVGKTFNLLKVADWHQRRGSAATFYSICTPGNGWEKFFAPGAEFVHLTNVEYFDVADIQDYFDVYDKIRPRAKPGDWLAFDVLGDAWNAAQDEYAEREWGCDLGSKWATEGGDYPIGGANWPWGSINARFRALAQTRMLRFPGHLLCMAWDKKVDKNETDPLVINTFGLIHQQPVGQKDDYKRFDTVIHLGRNQKGERVARTAKDRGGRRRLGQVIERGTGKNKVTSHVGEACPDFFVGYLKAIAGWSL